VRDQVLHVHKTTCKVVVLYISIFKYVETKQEDKIF